MVSSNPGPAEARRPENLALVYQELLTGVERLRSNRVQVTDAAGFRQQIKQTLQSAVEDGRRRGYTDEAIGFAQYAVVAFLDESILNLRQPAFADWPRQPLQEDLYRHHIAGEVFFQNLQKLLGQVDSQETADVLEVYQLCMLLGFAGRFSLGGRGELRGIIEQTAAKIRRIRQGSNELSRNWRLPQERIVTETKDAWLQRLVIASAACAGLALLLFVIYKFTLSGGISALSSLVG